MLGTFIAIWLIGASIVGAREEEQPKAVYISSEGIQFESYSPMWDTDRLRSLYELLIQCEHGEELQHLNKVLLYPEKSVGKSGSRVGLYDRESASISLYEVESLPVERTLIHEYGHHFTYYWLYRKDGVYPNQLTEHSEWAELRELDGYPVRWAGSKLPFIHKWDPDEIMAEDYVQLFGVGAKPIPDDPKDVVYLLRHENEYIPAVQTLPEVRRYWESAAGLAPRTPLKLPQIERWEPMDASDGEGEGGLYRLVFTSAAADDAQTVQYGIRVAGFSEQGGMPVILTAGLAVQGSGSVETVLDLQALQQLNRFYAHIQIWALEPESHQLMYTPFYMNWYAYHPESGALSATGMPLEKQGLPRMLKSEGMDRWPMAVVIMNGKPAAAVRKYDENGIVYVPLKVFSDDAPPDSSLDRSLDGDGKPVHLRFHRRTVQLQLNAEEADVDGQTIKLRHPAKKMGKEPAVPVDDLPELFGVAVGWDEDGSGMYVQAE
ncbi:stalk domain-containing protein [Paenibacillus konkukensis]|uniref:stalk domain-containing protein n=1 Tax=Paenibacillus konkukensis TaxID=2020716 RepID=UPI00201E0B51|nr:stalk domain-containing protein [Paenibacillus konkukensis]